VFVLFGTLSPKSTACTEKGEDGRQTCNSWRQDFEKPTSVPHVRVRKLDGFALRSIKI
jgi:hypothetical protein